jgi:hypothetical protein
MEHVQEKDWEGSSYHVQVQVKVRSLNKDQDGMFFILRLLVGSDLAESMLFQRCVSGRGITRERQGPWLRSGWGPLRGMSV